MQKKALAIAFFTIFLDLLGFGIIIPNNAFFVQSFGASPGTITLISAAYSFMQFLFAPMWGRLSDRYGRRPIMLWSIFVSCIGHLIFAFAPSLAIIFAARILAGFGNANLGAAQAIISDSTTPENRAKGMGLIGAAFGLGFLLGPGIGGFLSTIDPRAPSLCAAVLAFLNFIFAYFFLMETKTATSQKSTKRLFSLRLFRETAETADLQRFFLLALFYTFAFSLMEQVLALLIHHDFVETSHKPFMTLFGKSISTGAEMTAVFLVCVGLTAVIIQGNLIGRLTRAFGERSLLRFGIFSVGVSILLIPLVSQHFAFAALIPVAVLMACGTGTLNPSLASLVSRESKGEKQGQALGMYQSMGSLGRVAGPVCAGYLFEWSPPAPFYIGGGVLLLAFVYALNLGKLGVLKDQETA